MELALVQVGGWSMDYNRPDISAARRRKRWLLTGAVLVVTIGVSFFVARLEPAAPVVDRDTVWLGTVERGPMLREVRGHGTLQPEAVRWIPAPATGTVEKIHVEPGTRVASNDVLIELSNPEVEQMAANAKSLLRRALAEYESLRLALGNQELNRRAEAAAIQAEYVQATLKVTADRELAEKGLVSSIQLRGSEAFAEAMTVRRDIENERVAMAAATAAAQLEAKEAEIEQQRALAELRSEQLEALLVRAGLDGVVQDIPVEIGQQVQPGANLARVAEPSRLKAELKIPASQTRDLCLGLAVAVDTRNGIVAGRLQRIDPAVRQGTVSVDVHLLEELPAGSRPDLTVDGAIELEKLDDVLNVGRPVHSDENTTLGVFLLESDGRHASRVTVSFGRASIDKIEVVGGLSEGDQIVLSDTSRWDEHQRIQLN